MRLGDGVLGVYVDGVTQEFLKGEIKDAADVAGVVPVRLPGYWMHQENPEEPPMFVGQKPVEGEKDIAALNPFPAQLMDALAGYTYLVHTVGFPPSSIILTGDSAGGHLALALTRYLSQHAPGSLTIPGALLLLSPWADMSRSHNLPGSSMTTNRDCDIDSSPLEHGTVDAPAASLRAHADGEALAKYSPYFSPAGRFLTDAHIFRGFPRTLVTAGTAEMLLDQIRTLVHRMREDIGEDGVTYFEASDAVHDCVLFRWHEPERTQTLQIMKAWIETL